MDTILAAVDAPCKVSWPDAYVNAQPALEPDAARHCGSTTSPAEDGSSDITSRYRSLELGSRRPQLSQDIVDVYHFDRTLLTLSTVNIHLVHAPNRLIFIGFFQ